MTAQLELPAGLSAAERETIFQFDDADDFVTVWSANPVVLRRLHKLGLFPGQEARRKDGTLHGREYKIPKEQFRWGLKSKGHPAGKAAFRSKKTTGERVGGN